MTQHNSLAQGTMMSPLVLSLLVLLSLPTLTCAVTVSLQWDAYVQGPDPATGLNVYRQTACTGTWARLTGTPLQVVAITYSDQTVQEGQQYCWYVKAVDAAGTESDPSNILALTIPQPAAPTALAGTYTSGGVNLQWGYTQGADPAINFVIEKQVGCVGTWVQLATTPATQLTYRDTTIVTTQSYCYRVSAVDQNGGDSTFSNVLTFSVPKPAQPKNVRGVLAP